MRPPSKHRQAFVVWLAIYPLITVVLWAFGPHLGRLPLPLRTLALTGVLVPVMIYGLVPLISRGLDRLLPPGSG